MAAKTQPKVALPSLNGAKPEPPKQPSYLVVHEDGSVDGVRITKEQTILYAELLLSIASQMLGQFRASLAKIPEDSGDS